MMRRTAARDPLHAATATGRRRRAEGAASVLSALCCFLAGAREGMFTRSPRVASGRRKELDRARFSLARATERDADAMCAKFSQGDGSAHARVKTSGEGSTATPPTVDDRCEGPGKSWLRFP